MGRCEAAVDLAGLGGGAMLGKLNPRRIVVAHWSAFRDYSTGRISRSEVCFQILAPACISLSYCYYGDGISEGVAGIIVSAASIAAGLLLNLLVLIYTLIYNAKNDPSPIKNIDAFKQVSTEALATIGYSILLSLALVVASFFSLLSAPEYIKYLIRFVTVYIGCSVILCILIVLKRVFVLVHFEIEK